MRVDHPKVDVVVVTFRSAATIEQCLRSIPARPGIRTIVIENHSGDDTPSRAAALGAELVVNERNRGFGQAANQGARLGDAEAILFLNPDAVLGPDTLDRMLTALEDPGVGVVGATLHYPDGSAQRSLWPYPTAAALWSEALGVQRLTGPPAGGFVVGACFLVRRSTFGEVGGFDPEYWLYGEEADLCFRAERAGWRVVQAERAVCHHVSGASGEGAGELVAEHFARGSERFVASHGGPGALVSYRIAGLVGSLVRYPVLRLTRPGDERVVVRRRQIRRTLRVLRHHPTRLGPVARPDRLPEDHLVVFSLEPWDDVWRRNQFLVRELTGLRPERRVLWVEPPLDVLHDIRRLRRLPARRPARVNPVPGLPGVATYRPRKVLPRAVWPFVDANLRRQVTRVLRDEGFDGATLWVNDNAYADLVTGRQNRVVYDITDDWLDASGTDRELVRRRRAEHAMLDIADAVLVCSPELAHRRSAIRPVTLVPNAVDGEFFRTPQPRPGDLPRGTCVVYVGTLHADRVDVELVAECARTLPAVEFVFVGPQLLDHPSAARLRTFANVHLLGARPYASVPGYLQHADVVIVPHVVSDFTRSLDPIKAYECLAVGRPTLATPLPGFEGMPAPLYTSPTADFPDRLAQLVKDPPATSPDRSVPSWRDRAHDFEAALSGAAPDRPPPARIRVVYLGHTAIASGAEIALSRTLPGLTNVDAHVILGEDGPIVPALRAAGATVEILPMAETARSVNRALVRPGRLPLGAAWATVRYTWVLGRRLRELAPDVVHTNSLKAALYGGVAGRLARRPVLWHIRDRIADDYLPGPAVRVIRFLAGIIPHAVLTNSESTRQTLGRVADRASTTVVHDPLPAVDASSRPDTAEPVFAMIGRIAPWKGQDVFVRAFALAFPEGGARAVVVGAPLFGESDFEADLHSLAAQLSIADRIEFTGQREDVPIILGQVDVVVHASIIPEPFGQVVVEAMAAGRAVVASAAGGPLEIVTDGVDGLLSPPGDVEALAARLRRLADDHALRCRLGDAAVERARDFAPGVIGPRIERIYRRLANTRR